MTAGILSFGFVSGTNWSLVDGSPLAPAGTAQFPSQLSGYAIRPPWNVAAVDYAVGPDAKYGAGTAWKVPNTVGAGTDVLPSGSSLNAGKNRITITTANTTLDGWDFTQGNGQSLLIEANNVTVTNCKILKTDSDFSCIDVASGNGATIRYNSLDANGFDSDSGAIIRCNTGSGVMVVEYNYLAHPAADILYPSASSTWTIRYNLLTDNGIAAGAHPDWLQVGTGTYTLTINFNTVIMNNTTTGSQPFDLDTPCTLAGTNSQSFNTMLTLNTPSPFGGGTHNMNKLFDVTSSLVTGTFSIDQNYIDPTGMIANNSGSRTAIWDSGTYSGVVTVGTNFDMVANRITSPSNP